MKMIKISNFHIQGLHSLKSHVHEIFLSNSSIQNYES